MRVKSVKKLYAATSQHEHLVHALQPAYHHLANCARRFGPAKALLDELSLLLRNSVTRFLGDGVWHCRAPARGVLRHMRHNIHRQACLDELLVVTALVRTQRDGGLLVKHCLLRIKNHGLGRFALGVAVCPRHHSARNRTLWVALQRMSHETQFAGRPALSVQPGVRIGA